MPPFCRSQKCQNQSRVVIFDFDGVLADSFNSVYPLIRDGLADVGLTLTPDQYRKFFLGNIHQAFKNFINDPDKYRIFAKFREDNFDKYYKATLFNGAEEFITKAAANHILAIASSGRQKNIADLLEKNRIKKLFSMIVAASDTTKEKMINKILKKFNSSPRRAVMLTDTVGDIKMAKRMGLKTIAVTWGFHPKPLVARANPDYLATDFNCLARIMKKV